MGEKSKEMKLLNKIKIVLFLLFFILVVFQIKVMAVEGTVTEITVNVREKAATDSKRVMYVTQDDKVEVLAKEGSWYKIKAKNKTGYVYSKYIKVDDSKLEQENDNNNEEPEESKDTPKEDNQDVTQDTHSKLLIKKGTQVRIIPNISSNIIETAEKEISITIIEQMNNWTYVSTDKIKGWVRTDKVVEENALNENNQATTTTPEKEEENEETKQEEKIAYIKYSTVNLREKTSTSSKSLAKLKLNDEVTVLEKVNSVWTKVKVDGKTGYISNDLLSDKKQKEEDKNETTSRDGESTSRGNESDKQEESTDKKEVEQNTSKTEEKKETNSTKTKGEEIVAYAKKYLGYKYVYGAASPSTGFDCSGLTYYVYKHFGYTLSRSSTGQASNGTKVAKKDLQPGDLVIYKNTSLTKIGHVGIYIGDNKMIHASEPGVGVIITDIDSKAHKYPQRFVMGRRII